MTEESVELDDFHAHEVLHVCDVVNNMIERELINHPWAQAHPAVMKFIMQAQLSLSAAYQVAGSEIRGESK